MPRWARNVRRIQCGAPCADAFPVGKSDGEPGRREASFNAVLATNDQPSTGEDLSTGLACRGLVRLTIGCSVLFAVSVVLTMTTRRQISDDWTFAVWLREKGVFGILPYGYTNFTGRLPLLLFGGVVSSWPLMLALAVPLAMLVPAARSIRSLLGRWGLQRREATAFAALLVIGVVAGAPARNQAVFWPIGALVYLIPAVFFVGALTVLVSQTNRVASIAGGTLCAFAAASGNEIQAVVVPFVLLAVVVVQSARSGETERRRIGGSGIAMVLAAGAGGLALIGAPGNGGRSKMLTVTVKHDAATVLSSAKTVLYVLSVNLLAAGLVPAVTLVVAGVLAGRRLQDQRSLFRRCALIATVAAIISILTFCFVSAWGFNASAPQRSMFPVWMCCAASLFCTSVAIGARSASAVSARVRSLSAGLPGYAVMALAAPAFVAVSVAQSLPRDRAIARQLDCIERSVRDSGPNGTTIAAPQQTDSLLILEDSPNSITNTAVSARFWAGPVTRVNPGANAQCEAEAKDLARYIRPYDFGPPRSG